MDQTQVLMEVCETCHRFVYLKKSNDDDRFAIFYDRRHFHPPFTKHESHLKWKTIKLNE